MLSLITIATMEMFCGSYCHFQEYSNILKYVLFE
jgi:hypothetical protein